ncbi:MAG: DUF3551 domain-containing protein [Bradyrhizobium sp.]|uniref:DUF3551 domain-containing protein n=1 Tax=Bradyrhizobium sp. TaxID=376 RepID=UPI0025BFF69B|nr:DUF3551 domain-containing protein [Bradyrhizobium sp.]MBI5262050.1 DUF3551 domain-containing protein [Bradyrhizobium sp.]
MRRTIPLLLSAATIIVATWASVEPAEAGRYCLQSKQWGYPGNCSFATYRQCMATASGTEATCGINPRQAYARHWRW